MATLRQRLMKLLRKTPSTDESAPGQAAANRHEALTQAPAAAAKPDAATAHGAGTSATAGAPRAAARAHAGGLGLHDNDEAASAMAERARADSKSAATPADAAPALHTPAIAKSRATPRRIDLALQGGGSHGAFTWGVLDRLLEDETLEFSAVSGTSAGALNAGVLATGYARGGREGARAALAAFWGDVSREGQIFSPFSRNPNSAASNGFEFDKLPAYQWISSYFRSFSPYEFNPLNLNPLRDVIKRHIDEAALRSAAIPLFVTATSVATGQARVFTGKELSIDALLASACLPMIFQAVEIDGQAYWDGGYTGNPAIYPLIYQTEALDILLIRINPLLREGTPTRSMDIIDRVAEITFNASLIAEMRAIAFVSKLVREGRLDAGLYKDLRLHMVADDAGMTPYTAASKFNTDRAFLEELFALGRTAATAWLKKHGDDIGVRSSFDVEKTFLAKHPRTRRAVPAEGAGAA